MASRSLKNDQHADASGLKARDAQAQAGITGLRPLQQDGEPAGDLTRKPAMTVPSAPRAPRPGCAGARPDGEPALPLSVWATAQQDARTQRRGRYLPAATAHPAKMLPAIAAAAITRYSEPGDLVADPMCGIGTTLVEAIHLGRDAIGVEYEARWARIAAANITHARGYGATGEAEVIRGDARQLPALLPPGIAGRAALVVTSPPYGRSVHGQVRAERRAGGGGVQKYDNRYSDDPANLASHGIDDLLAGFTQILAGCKTLLRPGGTVVVTARPWRQRGELVDLPGAILAAGAGAGLIPAERCVALLAGLRGQRLIPRPSFFQLDNIRKARARGEPWHLIVHEDVLIFRTPGTPAGSRELQGPQIATPGMSR
jgi:modification methylase